MRYCVMFVVILVTDPAGIALPCVCNCCLNKQPAYPNKGCVSGNPAAGAFRAGRSGVSNRPCDRLWRTALRCPKPPRLPETRQK